MSNIATRNARSSKIVEVNRTKIFIVLGMHRSGTSLCASMLNLLGINITDVVGKDRGNELGHFERLDIVSLHDDILRHLQRGYFDDAHDFPFRPGWWSDIDLRPQRRALAERLREHLGEGQTIGFKDPRVSRLLPIWQSIFKELHLDPHYIVCLRNPADVAESLRFRDGLDVGTGEYRWLIYTVDALRHTKNSKRILLEYERWFADDAMNAQIAKLADFCDTSEVDVAEVRRAIVGLVSDDMNRSSRSAKRIRTPVIRQYYDIVRRLAADPSNEAAAADIDRFSENFLLFQQLTSPIEQIVLRARVEHDKLAVTLAESRQEKSLLENTSTEMRLAHAAAVDEAQGRNLDLANAVALLNGEVRSLRAEKVEADRLLAEAAVHATAAGQAQHMLQDSLERVSHLEASIAESQAHHADRTRQLEATYAEMQTQHAEHIHQLAAAQAEAQAQHAEHIHQLAAAHAEAQAQHADHTRRLELAHADAEAQHVEDARRLELANAEARAQWADRIRQLELAHAEAQARLDEMASTVATRQSELDAIRAEKAESDRLLVDAHAAHAAAASEGARALQEALDRARQLELTATEAQIQHAELASVAAARQSEIDTMRAEKAEAERLFAEERAALVERHSNRRRPAWLFGKPAAE